jgi:hypothetical protein
MALDLEEEKDVLGQYGDAWAEETLGQKKWNDKKEKMEQLNVQINTAKIKYHPNVSALMRVFEKFLKDANMNVYDETVKSIGYLARGLKKGFSDYAPALILPIITNIKKRPNIIQNVSD